jgi:hypothetical protein
MQKGLPIAVLLACLNGLWTSTSWGQESRMIELSAPRPPTPSESVEIQITTGPLPRGARLVVMSEQGDVLGAVTPFGVPGTARGSTATIPVPRTGLVDGRLRLQLQIVETGAAPRSPQTNEIQRVDIVLVPRSE